MRADRSRWLPIAGVLLGAPIAAEYLQAYLGSTGDLAELLGGLLVLGPLYGGAALLIREVAVRTGRGWRGILLMAGAFGVLMPGLVDLSLSTPSRSDVADWRDFWAPTEVGGISVYGGVAWPVGHVIMSIGVPLALLDALAPRTVGRRLLGTRGIVVMSALWLCAAVLIHADQRTAANAPSVAQLVGVLGLAAALIAIARGRYGDPLEQSAKSGPWALWRGLLVGFAAMLAIDLPPATWPGVAVLVVLVAVVATVVSRAARSTNWGARQVTALACGALLERATTGFVAPLPPGVDAAAKYAQAVVLLLMAAGVATAAIRRSAADPELGPAASA